MSKIIEKKKCTKCKKIFPLDLFPKTNKNKKSSWCKGCSYKASKKWRLENPKKLKEYQRYQYYKNCAERKKIANEYYHKNKELINTLRSLKYRRDNGLTNKTLRFYKIFEDNGLLNELWDSMRKELNNRRYGSKLIRGALNEHR